MPCARQMTPAGHDYGERVWVAVARTALAGKQGAAGRCVPCRIRVVRVKTAASRVNLSDQRILQAGRRSAVSGRS